MRTFFIALVLVTALAVLWLNGRESSRLPDAVVTEIQPETHQILTPQTEAMPGLPMAPVAQTQAPTPTPIPQPTATLSPFGEALQRWRHALTNSDNPQDHIVNALLEQNTSQREALLLEALQLEPYNHLLNYAILEHCLTETTSTLCGPEYLALLETMDSENAVIQDFKALDAYRNGDYQSALQELSNASQSRLTDMYHWQRISMVGESITRQGVVRDGEFLSKVLNESKMHGGPRLTAMYQMCQDQRSDPSWQSACLERGLAMNRNSASGLSRDFGYGLAMSIVDDPNRLYNEIAYEQQQRRRGYEQLERGLAGLINNPDWRISDQQWQRFIEIYSQSGEQEALAYLLQNG